MRVALWPWCSNHSYTRIPSYIAWSPDHKISLQPHFGMSRCVGTLLLIRCFISAATNLPPPLSGLLRPIISESRSKLDLTGIWDFRAEDYWGQGVNEQWYTKPLQASGNHQYQYKHGVVLITLAGPVLPMPVPASYNDITTNSSLHYFVGTVWCASQCAFTKSLSRLYCAGTRRTRSPPPPGLNCARACTLRLCTTGRRCT
jgi:hypothetical protein